LVLGITTSLRASAQTYGLDAPVAVAPFLDGVFPTTTPQGGTLDYTVADAFPNLPTPPLPTILVIESNPADNRLYLGARDGQIISIENDPSVTESKPFMDLRDRVAVVVDGGLLGLAFHPEFGQAGSANELTFYAYFSSYCPTDTATAQIDWAACNPGYPQTRTLGFYNTWLRLSRFTAYLDPVDGVYKGDAASEQPLFNIRLYNQSHRGGGPVFAQDGMLHVAIGDQFRWLNAQEIANTLEGGTLRLAVDVTDNGDGTWTCPVGSHLSPRLFQNVTGNADELSGNTYCIPDDNPWVDPLGTVMEEYWTIGHRNPHRISVDAASGRIWAGEVGARSVRASSRRSTFSWAGATMAGPISRDRLPARIGPCPRRTPAR
jgi:hypothetical protein